MKYNSEKTVSEAELMNVCGGGFGPGIPNGLGEGIQKGVNWLVNKFKSLF